VEHAGGKSLASNIYPMSKPKHIVAISGYARAGKDTLADNLLIELSRRQVPTIKYKFATALKRAANRALWEVGVGFDAETEDAAGKEKIRPLLVCLAQFCRAYDKDIFANATVKRIDAAFTGGLSVAVISDLRYQNEFECLHEYVKVTESKLTHIDIHRRGVFAAHQEELDSIEGLLGATYQYPFFHGVEFSDRDVAGIAMYAASVADDISNGREVRRV
jgi:hypothetical protein